ncbi:hypothetical protein TNCT1_21200 [Streptomyces sp. 1-11]|nr:hypothetical protein TNCT1_21200 [Streptomyces sp. 1-11]
MSTRSGASSTPAPSTGPSGSPMRAIQDGIRNRDLTARSPVRVMSAEVTPRGLPVPLVCTGSSRRSGRAGHVNGNGRPPSIIGTYMP